MKAERLQVFNKYSGKCAYCGCELTKSFHVDHIEPVRRHTKYVYEGLNRIAIKGLDHPERDCIDNKMPSCPSCNINKHSMTLEQFREAIKAYMVHLNKVSTQYKIAKRYGLVTENDIPVVFYFETLTTN